MAAGEVGRRREGELTRVDETTRVKRRKMVDSRIILSPCVLEATNSGGEEELDSCCSSNDRSEEKSKRKIEFVDPEEGNGGDQTETSWIYDNFKKRRDSYSEKQEESVNNKMEVQEDAVESGRRLRTKKKSCETVTVKEADIEGFFEEAEKDLRNKMMECSRKYNFDFEKEEPLGGRFEWVKLDP